MDRRDFIKLTAVTGTTATLAGCGNPEHQLIRFIPDEDLVPGVAEWKPSVCPMCAAGCGLTVRVMEADVETVRNGQAGVVKMGVAKKLEGDPKDPISQGGLCARGQAAIQVTYHPDRLTQPMKRSGARGAGEFKPVTWDEAIGELTGKLDALGAAGDQKSLAYLTGRRGRRLALATEFTGKFGAPAPIVYEAFGDDLLRQANAVSFGHAQLPTIDLARSGFVIGFGADFLGTWNSPVAQSSGYGAMRQSHGRMRGRFAQVESRMSLTGASADEWVPIKPGTEGVLALGLAHVIIAGKLRPGDAAGRAGSAIGGWAEGLADYAPAKVEEITGVAAKRVERLARELAERPPAVAVIGGAPLAHTNGLFHALAVNALNELLGTVGQPGGLFFTPGFQSPVPGPQPLAAALQSAKLLLVDDANPVFGTPKALKVREAIEKVPFIVSFGSFVDDTSALADLILPDHSFLESWVDSTPESGSIQAVTTVAGPVMKPLYQTRATADVLIEITGKLKTPIALPWKTAEEVANSKPNVAKSTDVGRPFQGRLGGSERPAPQAARYAAPVFDGDAAQYPLHFLPYLSQQFGDGSAAHLPWLQEMPDPLTSAMWSSWVEINPQTAERMHIAQGDLVDVRSPHGVVRAPAMIFPGIAPDVIAMPVGQGHEHFTRYASGRGVNPIAILAPVIDTGTGALAWAATRVAIARAGGPDGSLVMFAGEMREHPHEHETR
jgi:anaerobic selenocysteine-containing dehydrogenase